MSKEPMYNGPDVKGPTSFTQMAAQNPKDLVPLERALAYRLAKLSAQTAFVQEQEPIPSPGEPWWIGGPESWAKWTTTLQRRYWIAPGPEGKPFWTWSKGLLGRMVRAALFKGWAGYVGDRESCYQRFCLTCFAWPENETPTRQAFETYSGRDRDFATPVLKELLGVDELHRFNEQDMPHYSGR